MEMALTFNDVTLTPVTHQNTLWIRAAELARALGYAREELVSRLYQRNSDEFTPDMTQVIEIVAEHQNGVPGNLGAGRCRIFSLRGCHLLAMFARTPVAKAFRVWVLDVLDKLNAERTAEPSQKIGQLTPSHRAELKGIVDAKLSTYPASVQGKARSEIWTRFNRHFRIAEYAQLPAERMAEARDYLIELEVKALKALPTATPALSPAPEFAFRTDFPADMHTGRKDALRKIQSLMAGVGAARDVVRLFCHPGGKSMRMTLDEREIYDALYQLYCAADDSLLAAYRALDAGYKIGRQYGRG